MNNEETIKLEYTKELYNRTLKREKELNEEVEKIFGEIKIDIHNLIAEKLALKNTKEILFEEIQKQARQDERKKLIRREINMECLECGEPLPFGTHINLCDFHREKLVKRMLEGAMKEVKSQNEK